MSYLFDPAGDPDPAGEPPDLLEAGEELPDLAEPGDDILECLEFGPQRNSGTRRMKSRKTMRSPCLACLVSLGSLVSKQKKTPKVSGTNSRNLSYMIPLKQAFFFTHFR